MVTKKLLAIILKISTAQKLNVSFWTQIPPLQKYAASIDVKNPENGLSLESSGSKSASRLILSVSFVARLVAVPLNVLFLVFIYCGFLSKTNL